MTVCLFPTDRCFIKVSITYLKMPASLKRNCSGSVYQCPVVEYRQQTFVCCECCLFSRADCSVIILPMMKHLYDREYDDLKNEAVHQCQNLSEGTVKAKKIAISEKRNIGRLYQILILNTMHL